MADKPYEVMTIEELEAEVQQLGERRAAIAEIQRAAHRVLDQKLTERAAAKKIDSLSDTEKAALLQALTTESVGSGEEFGNLGQ